MKKYEIIYSKFRDDILSGRLAYHEYLPSIRQSVEVFHVSKTTVETAYAKLLSEGYISSKHKSGYIVSMSPSRVSLHNLILHEEKVHQEVSYVYDFRTKSVSLDSFDMMIWKRYIRNELEDRVNISSYGLPQGEYCLRSVLCSYVLKNRNILCRPDQIVVGSNYQSLLYVFCGLLDKDLRIGVSVHIDSQALHVFLGYGFDLVYLRDESFIEDLQGCDVLYINTTCFGVDKVIMSESLRKELCTLSDLLILEDDYNGEMMYESKVPPSLFSCCDHVIYFNSFSRLLLPSLRMSYMILNDTYTSIFSNILSSLGPSASKIEQRAFASYIVDGHLEKHLRRLLKEYRDKSICMRSLLNKYIKYPVSLNEVYMAYWFYYDGDVSVLKCKCEEYGIGISFDSDIVSLSFASLGKKEIYEGIILLAKVLKEC